MATKKKSFLLYFDLYPSLRVLPPEQRGELLLALFEFAMAAAEGPCDIGEILSAYPSLEPESRMAARFITDTIRRDTESWRTKVENCRRAAQERNQKGRDSPREAPTDTAERRATEQLRKMMQQRKAEEANSPE